MYYLFYNTESFTIVYYPKGDNVYIKCTRYFIRITAFHFRIFRPTQNVSLYIKEKNWPLPFLKKQSSIWLSFSN